MRRSPGMTLVLLASFLWPSAANAEVTIGVYFDPMAVTQSMTLADTGSDYGTAHGYFIVSGLEQGLFAFELAVSAPDAAIFFPYSWLGSSWDGCGFVLDPASMHCFTSGCVTPSASNVILGQFTVSIPIDQKDVVVSVGAASEPQLADGGLAIGLCDWTVIEPALASSVAGPGSAVINPSQGVPTTATSFARIKSLFQSP